MTHLGTTVEILIVMNRMEDAAHEYNRNTWDRRTSRYDRRKQVSAHTPRPLVTSFRP